MKASEQGERRVHPTQKPITLPMWCFAEFGKAGDVVLDLFIGSAPSLMAAERTRAGSARDGAIAELRRCCGATVAGRDGQDSRA